MKGFAHRVLVGVAVVALLGASAQGAIIQFDATMEFSGATAPAGLVPWLSASFDDGAGDGTVQLQLTTPHLSNDEFAVTWVFNLDPALDPTQLVFSAPAKTGSFDTPSVALGTNAFRADGDGWYDIRLTFASDAGTTHRFGAGDAVTYTLSYPSLELTAAAFDYLSAPGGGKGPYPMAWHVQGIDSTGPRSGWVAAFPEPTLLPLLGFVSVLLLRRRHLGSAQ